VSSAAAVYETTSRPGGDDVAQRKAGINLNQKCWSKHQDKSELQKDIAMILGTTAGQVGSETARCSQTRPRCSLLGRPARTFEQFATDHAGASS